MRTSPFTVHFWVSQFGLQLWFINRDEFPFGPASITRSYKESRPLIQLRFSKCFLGVSGQHYLSEGEHVEVGHVILMGSLDSLLALLGVYHLSHVLFDKVALEKTTNHTFYIVLYGNQS